MNSIPKDKLLHSFYGTLIYSTTSMIDPSIAIATVIIIAISKEIYDNLSNKGTPELMDIVATIAIPLILFIGDKYVK